MKRILGFIILGEFVICLLLLTIWLWQAYNVNGEDSFGILAYLLGLFVIPAVIIGLFMIRALSLRTKKTPPISRKVLAALTSTLQRDRDPRVRSKAAVGLAELDLEEASHHHKHNELDNILISALKDQDPLVRSKAAVGLAELQYEEASYRHEHSKMEEVLFEEGP